MKAKYSSFVKEFVLPFRKKLKKIQKILVKKEQAKEADAVFCKSPFICCPICPLPCDTIKTRFRWSGFMIHLASKTDDESDRTQSEKHLLFESLSTHLKHVVLGLTEECDEEESQGESADRQPKTERDDQFVFVYRPLPKEEEEVSCQEAKVKEDSQPAANTTGTGHNSTVQKVRTGRNSTVPKEELEVMDFGNFACADV